MKWEIATKCASELTEKTTLPQVMIKGFNVCEKDNSYFFGSKGLTRDYLPYNHYLGIETMPVPHQWGLFKSIL